MITISLAYLSKYMKNTMKKIYYVSYFMKQFFYLPVANL